MNRPVRIAVILPVPYRGGSLRGAQMLAEALLLGSRQAGEPAEIVLAHLDEPDKYSDHHFADLHPDIRRRPYQWQTLYKKTAERAMIYARQDWHAESPLYLAPDDGINQFYDCDLWVIVSDRLLHPLLPIRPTVHMVYDYIQRYEPILPHGQDYPYLEAARKAQAVMVTTRFTEQDALNYAGVEREKLHKVPMLVPKFTRMERASGIAEEPPYFIWTTNPSPHKNHPNAFLALREYYDVLGGTLKCHITGAMTENLLEAKFPNLAPVSELAKKSENIRKNVLCLGELADSLYQSRLERAAFLWHAGRIDNGTFSVVEAAHLGVPSLSSDYPAMREMDEMFKLNLAWMDPNNPMDMARALKKMEVEANERRKLLPAEEMLNEHSVEHSALAYWKVVRSCL